MFSWWKIKSHCLTHDISTGDIKAVWLKHNQGDACITGRCELIVVCVLNEYYFIQGEVEWGVMESIQR